MKVYRATGAKVPGTDGTSDTYKDTVCPLNDTEQKMIALLEQDSKTTQKMIAEELSISLRTVKRMMAEMQNNGTIERVGSNKAGYWKVNKRGRD